MASSRILSQGSQKPRGHDATVLLCAFGAWWSMKDQDLEADCACGSQAVKAPTMSGAILQVQLLHSETPSPTWVAGGRVLLPWHY